MINKLLLISVLLSFNLYGKELRLTILHTNDHHGRFLKNKHGEYGLAARKTLIDRLRREAKVDGREVLLLSGGDVNTGVPESDMLDAEPDFKGMNLLKYDAMAVGNHEFDNDLETLFKQRKWAGFPFLSANVFYQKPVGGFLGFFAKEKPFESYVIRKIQDFKIAIIGFTTEDTPQKVSPKNIQNLVFKSPIAVAENLIPKLKNRTDMIIAVTHMGHYDDGKHGVDAPGDVSLARAVKGIDVIVGGHSQKPLFKPDLQNGTFIVQAFEWGKFVGRMDLVLKDGKVELEKYELIPINLKKKIKLKNGKTKRVLIGKKIAEDPEMLALLKPYLGQGKSQLDIKIASTLTYLEGERSLTTQRSTALARLITTAFKAELNVDLSVMNSGGIRASIDKGVITYRDILKVLPFGGSLTIVEMKGSDLRAYLTQLILTQPKGTNGYPHFSGLQYKIRQREVINFEVNGQALQDSQTYKMALPKFLTNGGDKYPRIDEHPGLSDTGFTDAQLLKSYLKQVKVIKPNF